VKVTEKFKKDVLQCRSCNSIFHQSDVGKKQTERLGQKVEENICPICGSNRYGLIDYPVTEEELLYKNGKFHANYNRELKIHMDQVTEEILEEDKRKLLAVKKAEKINERYLENYRQQA